jgi:hypothetical protein
LVAMSTAIGAHEHNPRALGDLLSSVPVAGFKCL